MATQGPNSGGTFADDDSYIGTGMAWTNPSNAASSNNSFATNVGNGSGLTTSMIRATNFGFSIPTGATIDGILYEIEIKCNQSNEHPGLTSIATKDAGSSYAGERSDAAYIPTSDTIIVLGGAADLWDNTWTVAEINSSNFGFGVYVAGGLVTGTATLSVDHIRVTVYYTPVAGGLPRSVMIQQAVNRASTY